MGDWGAGWINFDGGRVNEAQVTDVCPDDAAYPGTIGTQTSLPAGYHFEQLLIYPHGGSPLQQQGQPANYTIETVCRPDTIPDVCTNLSGNQSSTPIQVAGVWYDDLDGDKVCSPMANPSDSIDLCPDNLNPNLPGTQSHLPYLNPADGKWYDDPNHDGRCTVALDICPIAPGNQTSNATNTWQVSGVWYGLSNNICVKDVCPDNSKYTPTSGFQAVVPTNYEIVAGVCQPKTIIDGNPGQGVPVDPIYKEN